MCDPYRYPWEESKAKVIDFEMEYGKSSQVSSKSCDLASFYVCKRSGKLRKFFVYILRASVCFGHSLAYVAYFMIFEESLDSNPDSLL